ncbi:MAG: prepilin-type N-terminal cleavage/methylation domain-containing protein [Bacteriovoracaceae bacterium]|nr:prepilin-type N-terminal cleavage/methylation domain-containing protein [Bacteriovoracaceae bacterium]
MPTFLVPTCNKLLKNSNESNHLELGFTLMEILAVISLISIIFYVGATMMRNNSRDEIEQVVNTIQRGVRFANDEAVIRNFTVRLKISMDKGPQVLALEYTTQTDLLINDPTKEDDNLVIEDKETILKRQKEINQSFLVNEDFKKNVEPIPESVIIFAAKTADQNKLSFQQEFNLYFYPSGIRDQGQIYLANIEEFALISIDAVRDKIDVEYRKNPYGLDDVQSIRNYLQDWSKEKP